MSDIDVLEEMFADVGRAARFTRRDENIPGDSRVAWRLSVLALLLVRGRSNTLALEHLHVLWWAIRSSTSRDIFLRWISGERRPDELLVRFDPSLTLTVDLAQGQGLVVIGPSGSVQLTAGGLSFALAIGQATGVLEAEKAFLQDLPSRISQKQIQQLLEWS